MFSIMDMTEKVVDPNIENSSLLPSQRSIDNRPATDNSGEMKPSPQLDTENEEEVPFFTKYAHLVPTAKSLDPESEEDELSSSSEVLSIKNLTKKNSYSDSK